MTRYDITIAMGAGTPEWPGDTPFSCGWAWDMAAGASVNVGKVTTSLHVGTHADAPLHERRHFTVHGARGSFGEAASVASPASTAPR